MKLGVAEILEKCSKLTKNDERVNFLRQNDSVPLRVVLQYALDSRVEWLLPLGTPPYKPTEHLDQEGNLYRNIRKVNLFVKGGDHPTLHPIKRETLFIQFLEGLAPKDAELICAVKDKKIPYKGITTKLVNAAFPGLVYEQEQ